MKLPISLIMKLSISLISLFASLAAIVNAQPGSFEVTCGPLDQPTTVNYSPPNDGTTIDAFSVNWGNGITSEVDIPSSETLTNLSETYRVLGSYTISASATVGSNTDAFRGMYVIGEMECSPSIGRLEVICQDEFPNSPFVVYYPSIEGVAEISAVAGSTTSVTDTPRNAMPAVGVNISVALNEGCTSISGTGKLFSPTNGAILEEISQDFGQWYFSGDTCKDGESECSGAFLVQTSLLLVGLAIVLTVLAFAM
jgi:hypothetical protein